MDYEEMSEPNMKLSRALLIVLVLHVVAVAGIVAFNTIKTRQGSLPPIATTPVENKAAPETTTTSASTSIDAAKSEVPKSAHTVAKGAPKPEHTKKGDFSSTADLGKTYVVAKGDNPVTIARKLKVPYDELLALNHIDDPRKLQIGQKLFVPKSKSKKSSE